MTSETLTTSTTSTALEVSGDALFGVLVTYHGSITPLFGTPCFVRRYAGSGRYELRDLDYSLPPLLNVRRASFSPVEGDRAGLAVLCSCGHDVTQHGRLTCRQGLCAVCDGSDRKIWNRD